MSETFCDENKLNGIKNSLGYFDCFIVPNRGDSGGLAFLSKKEGIAHLIGSHNQYIDVEIRMDGEEAYRITSYYGIVDRNRRHESWALLCHLSSLLNLPWLILGDFNDLLA